jgi:oligopeptide transport system permease protein
MGRLSDWRRQRHKHQHRSLWQDALARLLRNRAAVLASLLLLGIVLLVIAGPLLSPWDAEIPDWDQAAMPPDTSSQHWFGTDVIGRDLFIRVLEGGRVSLLVALLATLVSLLIGVGYGAIAGYFGGRLDAIMMRLVDILYALPFLFFVILLMVIFQRNILLVFIAIGAINWLDMARIVRGQTMSLRNRPYVQAAEAMGVKPGHIISRHILPNLLGVVVVYATLTIPQIMLMESFLSFLGLGVQEPATSLGALVSDGAKEMQTSPWTLLFPGGLLALILFCFNFIGDGLRDALDPREHL